MPRRRHRKRSSKPPTHFTTAEIHQLQRKARAGSSIAGKPLANEVLRLAVHLCCRCPSCWQAVDQLTPRLRARFCDPVTDAIALLANRTAWIVLKEDERWSLRQVRERPYGFAYVVLAMAATHALTRGLAAAGITPTPTTLPPAPPLVDSDEFLFWATGLVDQIGKQTGEYESRDLGDLVIYFSCRLVELNQLNELSGALELLDSIHTALEGSTRQPHVLLAVHELEIQIYSEVERFEEAEDSYRKSLDLLGPDQGLYRFEMHSLAITMLFQRKVPPAQRHVAFATALAEFPPDPDEPLERLIQVHTLARATRRLAQHAHAEGLQTWPGIRRTLHALDQTRPLHREHGDSYSLEMADSFKKDLEYLATKLAPLPPN